MHNFNKMTQEAAQSYISIDLQPVFLEVVKPARMYRAHSSGSF